MLKSIRKGLVTLFFIALIIGVDASHVPGGNISYENVNVRNIADSLVKTYLAYEG